MKKQKAITVCICLFTVITSMNYASQKMNSIDTARKIGPVYFVDIDNSNTALLSVVEIKSGNNFHYYLQLNDAKTATVMKRKEIFITKDSISAEHIAGTISNNIWVLSDSIVAYNMMSLEPVITETMIAEKNSFMQNNFSRFANNYLADEAAKVLYITTANGDGYKLYPDNLVMKQDNSSSDPAPDGYSYEFAAEYKVADRYPLKFALSNIDTFNNSLYILGSIKETSQVLSYFGSSIYNERDEVRQLTRIAYNNNGDKMEYAKNKPVTSVQRFYKGGFLQKKFTTVAWHGPSGEKIILHSTNDKSKTLLITLIDAGGATKWIINTKYASALFSDFLVDQQYLVLWFSGSPAIATASRPAFLSIDISSGTSRNYDYQP